MSERSVLYLELFQWLEVSDPVIRFSSAPNLIVADYLQSRGFGKSNGAAYHDHSIREGCGYKEGFRQYSSPRADHHL